MKEGQLFSDTQEMIYSSFLQKKNVIKVLGYLVILLFLIPGLSCLILVFNNLMNIT